MRTAITGPEAWSSREYASGEGYRYVITPEQIEELDRCCAQIEARGMAFYETRQADFALSGWTATFADLNAQLKAGRGFALLCGLPVARWGKARARLAVWGLGLHVGEHVSQTVDGQLICDVLDTTKGEASPRQFKTNRELSLHTDPVSDLIGLACLQPAQAGGLSVLASAPAIYNRMLSDSPELLDPLFEGFFLHRFGEGRSDDAPVTEYRVPMLAWCDSVLNCRYVRTTIVAGHKALDMPLTSLQIAALDRFDALARAPEIALSFQLDQGDLLLVNNLCVLHARTGFVDFDDPARVRHLLRLWLKGPDGFRPVPRAMNYFNDGACGIPRQAGVTPHYDVTQLTRADGLGDNPTGRPYALQQGWR